MRVDRNAFVKTAGSLPVSATPKFTTVEPIETPGGRTEYGVVSDQLCINTIRTLAMDAVQQANSGHPGTPMALAPVVYTLWQSFLRFDPDDPSWPNRDRFVLSNGHASMLLYAMLHLGGVKAVDGKQDGAPAVTLDDIRRFRQLDSKCPGHPEYGLTSGVETTTGPLGQGCGNSVGMALAARWLARHFNRPGFAMFDYDVYAVCSDGDMMEGVASEAASFAGHQMLGNLCWIYDSNRVTIEGHTETTTALNVWAVAPCCPHCGRTGTGTVSEDSLDGQAQPRLSVDSLSSGFLAVELRSGTGQNIRCVTCNSSALK
jgi:transketolase N-terminal domain/subunit